MITEGLPFVESIDYEKFCFFMDEQDPETILGKIFEIIHLSDFFLQTKFEYLKRVRLKLVWRDEKSLVPENLVTSAEKCIDSPDVFPDVK